MKKEYIPIIFLTFVNTLNFAVLIPVLPFIIRTYGGGPITYGIILSAYPFFQFFAAPLLGNLSDKYGRRPILLISQAGTLASWIFFAFAYFLQNHQLFYLSLPLIIILIARTIDGATGGNTAVSEAYLADISKPEERTKVYGITGGVLGVAIILGPVLGSISNSFSIGFLGTALLTVAISLVTLIIMYFFLPESLPEIHRKKHIHFNLSSEFDVIKKIKRFTPEIQSLFLLRTFFLLVFSGFTSIFVFFVVDVFSLTAHQVTLLFLFVGISILVNQSVLVNFFAKRFGELRVHNWGVILMLFSQIAMVFVPNVWLFIPVIYFNNLGFSLSMPTFKSIITTRAHRSEQGEINGIDQSIWAGTSAIAPFFVSLLYGHIGQYVFLILSIILAVALLFFRKRNVY